MIQPSEFIVSDNTSSLFKVAMYELITQNCGDFSKSFKHTCSRSGETEKKIKLENKIFRETVISLSVHSRHILRTPPGGIY